MKKQKTTGRGLGLENAGLKPIPAFYYHYVISGLGLTSKFSSELLNQRNSYKQMPFLSKANSSIRARHHVCICGKNLTMAIH